MNHLQSSLPIRFHFLFRLLRSIIFDSYYLAEHRDYLQVGRTMMMNAPKITSMFARCRTQQLRCVSSLSSMARTTTCSDSHNFLALVAKNSNKIDNVGVPLPKSRIRFNDRSLLGFVSAAQNVQPSGDLQLLASRQVMNHRLLDDPSDFNVGVLEMGRNTRRPKKANKGARPCSRAGRRKRKEKIGRRSR